MAKHFERVLGIADEEVEDEGLSIETYLDVPTDNPVKDMFASNTELEDYENPAMDFLPEDLAESPQEREIVPGVQGSEPPMPQEMAEEGSEEAPTQEMKQALAEKFIEKARTRLVNSIKFQNRANLLNEGSENDDDAGV